MNSVPMDRRRFLETLGLLALSPLACAPGVGTRTSAGTGPGPWAGAPPAPGVVLNDVHSRLNETRVARVAGVSSLEELHRAILGARSEGLAISISGGGHSMGGQQYGAGTVHLDTRRMNRVLAFDSRDGIVKVEAGIQWPDLVGWLAGAQAEAASSWGIVQKQTGADRFALGGALSANVHGRGLTLRPIVQDVESFTLIDGNGGFRTCSRGENDELFRLAIGGLGLFGAIYSVKLRLQRRQLLVRSVDRRDVPEVVATFEEKIGEGAVQGELRLDVDHAAPTFLKRGVLITDRPAPPGAVESPADAPEPPRPSSFDATVAAALAASGRIAWSDTGQLFPGRGALEGMGTGVLAELCLPLERVEDFLDVASSVLVSMPAVLTAASVRLVERDVETVLAWARERSACVLFEFRLDPLAPDPGPPRSAFRALLALALERGGRPLLAYPRWATAEELRVAYPRLRELLEAKRRFDPAERFQSEWARAYREIAA